MTDTSLALCPPLQQPPLSPSPPPSLMKPSVSLQENSALFKDLHAVPIPDKELEDLIRERDDALQPSVFFNRFDTVAGQLNKWLETAHMTVFMLEQTTKDESNATTYIDTVPLEEAIGRMQPVIAGLVDVGDMIDELEEENTRKMTAKMTIAKIQSEWSGLQHFATSVKASVNSMNEEKELAASMERILLELDDISTLVFQYHERKHAALSGASSPASMMASSFSSEARQPPSKEDRTLIEIDNKVEPVFHEIEKVYARMMSDNPPKDRTGILARKHAMVQERWEHVRTEIDDLKYGLKEDRWLTVFRQVADQVDVMIDGLEKTTAQCYTMISQVRSWQAASQGSPAITETAPKGVLRNAPRPHPSNTSVSSTSSSGSTGYGNQPPVDHHKFRSLEKNFEAKYKYYTPSIDRMLAMLGNGIASRVGRDTATIKRHQAMLQRWSNLKAEMDELRLHELPDIERILISDRPISPAWSRMSDRSDRSFNSWKDIRYRSPEPGTHDLSEYLGGVPGSGRSRSPYSSSVTRSNLCRTSSPLGIFDERRGRSATPNSAGGRDSSAWRALSHAQSPSPPVYGKVNRTVSPLSFGTTLKPSSSDSSSVSSSSLSRHVVIEKRKTKTPVKSTWNASVRTDKSEFSSLDPLWKSEGMDAVESRRKSRVPETKTPADNRASWMRPTKSSTLRKQSAASNEEEAKRLPPRSKTPNFLRTDSGPHIPARPKSSMESRNPPPMPPLPINYPDRERAMSPERRSGTPSLIPRPKTPSGSSLARSASPSMIRRPRSSMQHHQHIAAAVRTTYMLQVHQL